MNTPPQQKAESVLKKYLRLRLKVARLTDPSEREDLLAEIHMIKSTSIGFSVLCALDDVQSRFPLLLPLLVVCLALQMVI